MYTPELLEDIFRQEFENHASGEVSLKLLITSIGHSCEIQPELLDVLEAYVLRADEAGEEGIFSAAKIQGHIAVEKAHGELMPLFADETDLFEV